MRGRGTTRHGCWMIRLMSRLMHCYLTSFDRKLIPSSREVQGRIPEQIVRFVRGGVFRGFHEYETMSASTTEHAQVCCSGTKQPRVILSLHDTDMCGCARRGIRSRVKPAPRTACNNIDRWIRLVLKMPLGRDSWPSSQLDKLFLRRVGNVMYTHDFAERLFNQILLHSAKAGRFSVFMSAACLVFNSQQCKSYTGLCRDI